MTPCKAYGHQHHQPHADASRSQAANGRKLRSAASAVAITSNAGGIATSTSGAVAASDAIARRKRASDACGTITSRNTISRAGRTSATAVERGVAG